jgi:N-acylneuraminate cytidylyltransferase
MSGEEIWPIHIDTKYSVDIDTLSDLQSAESLALTGHLEMVWPGKQPRPLPQKVKLVIFDFDGVITDDRVWVDAEGREQVAANRGDGMGIGMLKEAGIKVHVLSTETNPVVAARCKKLDVPVIQGQKDKTKALKAILKEHEVGPEDAVYLGNDINDLVCFPLVACAVVVNDAHQSVVEQADLRLKKNGGHGAVRELCDLILKRYS